jgi:hypothetical protein
LALDRFSVAAVLIAAALGLCACGRVGPLQAPPGPAAAQPAPAAATAPPPPASSADASVAPATAQDSAMKNSFDVQGNPVAPPGQKKPFILDPLLQ